jgi:3-oxoacyl-[acyl-carrier protein] reductase
MAGSLAGKVAVVTGASAGIGMASARALAGAGARVVLTARRGERLEALAKELGASVPEPIVVVGAAREEATARAVVDSAMRAAGRIDILLNNAGMGIYKNLVDTSAEDYDEMMDTNMRSTFLFTRHVAPVMVAQKSGTILMLSSMAGKYGFPG